MIGYLGISGIDARCRAVLAIVLAAGILSVARPAWAIDVFDRHGAEILKQVAEADAGQAEFSEAQGRKLKPLSRDIEGSFLVIKTNKGNLAKVLVSWGFRKQADVEKPVPVLMLDRYVTYEQGRGDTSIANGTNVMVFPGFQFDFDLGQIVPKGFGADIEFTEKGAIKGLEAVQLHAVSGSQLPAVEAAAPGKQAPEVISPEDFSGVWNVDGDGRWIGEWDLNVNEEGEASGTFLSAETKSGYPITGQIGGLPHQIKLQISFNNTTQVVDAYLWTKDKSKLAGSFTMAGRKFGISGTRQPAK